MTIWPYYGQNMAQLWSVSFVLYVTFVCPAKLFRENFSNLRILKANNLYKCPEYGRNIGQTWS